jgi:hypothetical protein
MRAKKASAWEGWLWWERLEWQIGEHVTAEKPCDASRRENL